MKKIARILSVLVAAIMLMTALSVTVSASEDTPYDAFADYGQQTHNVPPSEGIKIDGIVSEGEYACEPIEVSKDSEGMTWLDWTKEGFPEEEIPEILPYSIKYYVTYDDEGLYVAAEIVEASLFTRCNSKIDIWGLDSLEIDVAVDAYGDIENGTYTQAYMLDRIRSTYALWDDGSGVLTPVGICYTGSSYGIYKDHDDMLDGTYMVTRDDEKQLTTYETFFSWEDLYMEKNVPDQVFMNFQLHLGDARYLDYVADGYIGCLGGLRYACQLSDQDKADIGTDKSMALHIFNLVDDADSDETEAPSEEVTEAPTEEVTEAPTEEATEEITEAPTQADTQAPETEAPTAAPETEPEKNGCGSAIGMTAAVTAFAAAAAVVLKKKD